MKEFNKTQELLKLRIKQNKNTYIKRISIILSCVILLIGIIMFTFAKFESNKSYTLIQGKLGDYSTGDVTLSYVVDGVKQDTPPDKNNYLLTNVECTNGDVTFDSKTWKLIIENYTSKVKCNLTFEEAVYNNVTKWIQTANINKSYTTLNEVFNDTTTLSSLTTNQASCDYLKNSTEWISDVTSNENAMTYIGNNDYCANTLLDDSNWSGSILNSTYFDKVAKPLVPNMTSNTTPKGIVRASSYSDYSSWTTKHYPYYAFNTLSGSNSTTAYQYGWWSNGDSTEWIEYEFTNKVKVYAFSVVPGKDSAGLYAQKYELKISNDGNVYNSLTDTLLFNNVYYDSPVINLINNADFYLIYRIVFNGKYNTSYHYIRIGGIQFYGREVPE